MIKKNNLISKDISENLADKRLDVTLAETFPEYSRSKLKKWLENGYVSVNHQIIKKASQKLVFPSKLELNVPEENLTDDLPEKIRLNLLEENEDFVVIEKPPGLVVHPGAGNKSGTLLNALLHSFPELKKLPRAGIVHRLDKDTSGLMVVARNEKSLSDLSNQISNRSAKRVYEAFTVGKIDKSGKVDAPIGRHPQNRQKQAVRTTGKEAVSHFKVLQTFGSYSHIQVTLETGRTHQIRVHMNYLGYPLIGDPLYGRRRRFAKNTHQKLREIIEIFPRQALHAVQLSFFNPKTKKNIVFNSKLPNDLLKLKENLIEQT